MKALAAVVLLSVNLAPPFGRAEATATSVDADGMTLEVEVEVLQTATAVLVRGRGSGGAELPPVALADTGGGTWVGIVELPLVENIRMGFELIDGTSVAVSELHTLVELGVDEAVFQGTGAPSPPPEPADAGSSDPAVRWVWLAVATGAAGLALLLVWAFGPFRRESAPEGTLDEWSGLADNSADADHSTSVDD